MIFFFVGGVDVELKTKSVLDFLVEFFFRFRFFLFDVENLQVYLDCFGLYSKIHE